MATDRRLLYERFGNPFTQMEQFEKDNMVSMDLSKWPELKRRKIYVNKYLFPHLTAVFDELQRTGYINEIETFDGCWSVRYIRGYENQRIESIHAWAIAIDFNASQNPLGGPVRFSEGFLNVWRKLLWTCGADFHRLDGMHFQYTIEFEKK